MDHQKTVRRKLYKNTVLRRRSLEPRTRKCDDLYGPGPDLGTLSQTSPSDHVLSLNHRSASVRLDTFPRKAHSRESTRLWASNGFFCNEKGNAECFSCHYEFQDWKNLDDPNKCHLEKYRNCRFRRGEATGNVPFNCRPLSQTFSSDEDIPPMKRKSVLDTPPMTPQNRKKPMTAHDLDLEVNEEFEITEGGPSSCNWQSSNSSDELDD